MKGNFKTMESQNRKSLSHLDELKIVNQNLACDLEVLKNESDQQIRLILFKSHEKKDYIENDLKKLIADKDNL